MRHTSNKKWQMTHDGRRRTTKSSTNQNARRKGNLQKLGNIGGWHHQTWGDERKNLKRASQKNQKITRNKTLEQEPCQRDKYLGCPPCKILGTILEVDREELKQMEQRTRKLMTVYKALHLRYDVDRRYVSRKEGGRGLSSIEDSVDASMQWLGDYIEKCRGWLITATRNNTKNTRTSGTTITRKQKWEERQHYGCFKRQASDISHKNLD